MRATAARLSALFACGPRLPEDTASGDPPGSNSGVLVDPDALTLPIARSPDFFEDGTADPLTVFVHRVSFAGEPLGATELDLDGASDFFPWFAPARGSCGELLLFQEDPAAPWLAAFSP